MSTRPKVSKADSAPFSNVPYERDRLRPIFRMKSERP
jgi:hypothetical protein